MQTKPRAVMLAENGRKSQMKTMKAKQQKTDEKEMMKRKMMINDDNEDESKLILVYLFCNFLRCLSIQ